MGTFTQNLGDCISSVSQIRNLVPSARNPRKRQKRGPEASTVKVKFYHLPEGSVIPRLTKNRDGNFPDLFITHKNSGYGIYVLQSYKILEIIIFSPCPISGTIVRCLLKIVYC